ncbi:MAG TPA: 16S rRNA (cytosine(1402)-N(4))-methyltransferase RsmH [Microbacteriaceae bacterium]|nr:16S rRNA (cytosine(1402)-N(4))-methyltransferase RsmH [Microbacteriaceae bacterium]
MNEQLDHLHTPVLLERCLDLLAPALDGEAVVIDATLGMGGHTLALLQRFPNARVVGFDRDTQALEIASQRLAPVIDRVSFVHATFDHIDEALDDLGIDTVHGALFDLGVSSLQLDRADRGFAYAQDAPLDMRMDQTTGETAADLINGLDEDELRELFWRYGDEKLAPRYARAIVKAREAGRIERSAELVDILQQATPAALKNAGHPAKRVFQALRVAVNHELDVLERALPAALARLAVGGRIVVMSYQSMEDRFVKRTLQALSVSTAPPGLPQELPEHAPQFKLLVRGAELASEDEALRNSRAKPVRLRAAERLRAA